MPGDFAARSDHWMSDVPGRDGRGRSADSAPHPGIGRDSSVSESSAFGRERFWDQPRPVATDLECRS
eukprot:8510760-Pyramimonas_sp.AAC.1